MKKYFGLPVIYLLLATTLYAQNKRVGITQFSVEGSSESWGQLSGIGGVFLFFIGNQSTELSPGVYLSDEMVRHTETALEEFLGHAIFPAKLDRPEYVRPQTRGVLWVMETISPYKAFKKLGYDEVVEVRYRIGSTSSTNKGYRPKMKLIIKITEKNGDIIWKKTEELRLEDLVPKKLVEHQGNGRGAELQIGSIGIGLSGDDDDALPPGVPASLILDWYKQALEKVLVKQ